VCGDRLIVVFMVVNLHTLYGITAAGLNVIYFHKLIAYEMSCLYSKKVSLERRQI
jgi:hypothetical protein